MHGFSSQENRIYEVAKVGLKVDQGFPEVRSFHSRTIRQWLTTFIFKHLTNFMSHHYAHLAVIMVEI